MDVSAIEVKILLFSLRQFVAVVVVKIFCGTSLKQFSRQILVTVPQCLEILFLSPRRQDWTKNIKYVIFDEVDGAKRSSLKLPSWHI